MAHGLSFGQTDDVPPWPRDGGKRHVEMVFKRFFIPALGVRQTSVLPGIPVEEFDLESALVPRPNVMNGELQVCADEYLDRFDFAVLFQFIDDGYIDHTLQRLHINGAAVNAVIFIFSNAR